MMRLARVVSGIIVGAALLCAPVSRVAAQVPQYCLYVVEQAIGCGGDISAGDVVCSACRAPCEAVACVGNLTIGRVTRACVLTVGRTEAYGDRCGPCFEPPFKNLGAGFVCQ